MRLLVLVTILSVAWSQQQSHPAKRSYVCPPNFLRQGHRCYFFSKNATTWTDAMFQCRAMHSKMAIIKSRNQDKLVRRLLSQKQLEPLERWLGGVYDWKNMTWKWGASGKPLGYNGFTASPKEKLEWHCIIMDPALEFGWSSRMCFQEKHYICNTKLKIATNKDKKKLRRHYNVNEYNKLNEIPVPSVSDYTNNTFPLKANIPITYKFEINDRLNDQALFAFTPKEHFRKARKNKKRKAKKPRTIKLANGTVVEVPKRRKGSRRKKHTPKPEDLGKPTLMHNIRWRTYKKENRKTNSLYPSPIVEEYNYVKE